MRGWLSRNRASVFLVALLIAGAILGQTVAERTTSKDGPALSSTDSGDRGALALALWLERLGYRVQRIDRSGSSLDDVAVLFVLLPVRSFDRTEAAALAEWVRRGGTLVYAPPLSVASSVVDPTARDALAGEVEVDLRFVPITSHAPGPAAFFSSPPGATFNVATRFALELRGDGWVPLVQEGDRIFAATRQLGQGRVYAVSSEALFSNNMIGNGDNAAFALNVLARTAGPRTVAFEEAHHRRIEAPDLLSVMRVSPWGWSVMYAFALTFGFLAWGGRRFGPPVVAAFAPPRSTGEYISGFAGLLQRARATDWLQKRYAALVRRRLASRLGVRADLPADELARLLAERLPIDRATLAANLTVLDGPALGERRLLDLVRSVEETLRTGDH